MGSRTSTAVSWAFGSLVVVFGAVFVASRWEDLSVVLRRIDAPLLVASTLFALAAGVFAVFAWQAIWPAFSIKINWMGSARYFFLSQVGKYIPGSVWSVAAQAKMTAKWGIPIRTSVAVGLLALGLSISVALMIGSLSLIGMSDSNTGQYWWLPVIALLSLALLSPPVLQPIVNAFFSLLRKNPLSKMHLSWGRTSRIFTYNSAYWFLSGLHFWVILIAIGADPWLILLPAISAYAAAFAIGVLFIPAPAGIGVREFVMVIVLAGEIGETDALAAALVSRVLLALVDFGLALLALWIPLSRTAVDVANP